MNSPNSPNFNSRSSFNSSAGSAPAAADPELRIHGEHACQAVAKRRPEDIRRVYLTKDLVPNFGELLRWCAANRLAYHIVGADELEKITQSVHHGGIAMIVREPPPLSFGELVSRLRTEPAGQRRALVYVDNVQNPHNLGAIVRVAAHFGSPALLMAGDQASVSPAMIRTAEGGAEWVDVIAVPRGPAPLLRLREAGLALVATSSHSARQGLYEEPLPRRCVLMMGSETHGLAPELAAIAGLRVAIPGTGQVESLNVASATAVLLGEHWRAHPPGSEAVSEDRHDARSRPHPGSRDRRDGGAAARQQTGGARAQGEARGQSGEARGQGERRRGQGGGQGGGPRGPGVGPKGR
jgi:TrmH RNA methyltransferase